MDAATAGCASRPALSPTRAPPATAAMGTDEADEDGEAVLRSVLVDMDDVDVVMVVVVVVVVVDVVVVTALKETDTTFKG